MSVLPLAERAILPPTVPKNSGRDDTCSAPGLGCQGAEEGGSANSWGGLGCVGWGTGNVPWSSLGRWDCGMEHGERPLRVVYVGRGTGLVPPGSCVGWGTGLNTQGGVWDGAR